MHYTVNLPNELSHVHPNPTLRYPVCGLPAERTTLVTERGTGYELPEADAYARRLAEGAEVWLEHARERSRMKESTLVRKALSALAFSMRHRTRDLAVPSKLSGTSRHQAALWGLVKTQAGVLGTPLDVEELREGRRVRLVVSHEGDQLGEVQSKHVPWLRPLVPFGAALYLVRVTGRERDYTLGCNVAIGRAGRAVTALRHALGHDVGGDGYGGDGATQASLKAAPTQAQRLPDHGGDGATNRLRLVLSGSSVAKPRADTKPGDVVLYRDIDGTACATVGARPLDHVVRHSPSGIEWGYAGSGPADLARSILCAFTDEDTAERLYVRFKEDVVARVPRSGGVIRAADVQAWLAARAR